MKLLWKIAASLITYLLAVCKMSEMHNFKQDSKTNLFEQDEKTDTIENISRPRRGLEFLNVQVRSFGIIANEAV